MEDLDKPVVLVTAASLQEADVIRMLLQAEEIPVEVVGELGTNTLAHASLALNPQGIRIQVPQSRLQEAQEILVSQEPLPDADEPETENEADDYARRGFRCAIYTLILTLTFPLTVYFFIQALRARTKVVPANPRRYRRYMILTFVVGILPYVLVIVAYTFSELVEYQGPWGNPIPGY